MSKNGEKGKHRREYKPERAYGRRSRDTEAGSCTRKVTFETVEEATAAANAMSERDGTLTTHYECKFCGKFHLSKEGVDVLDLPDTYKDQPVFFDERGPYLKVMVPCVKCGKSEPGKQRISVVDGQYTRTQGTVLDDPNKMKHPKAGSKTYVHVGGCPVEAEPEGKVETPPPAAEAPKQEGSNGSAIQQGMTGFVVEIPFDEELLMELDIVLDPANRNTYTAEFANGAAWLFNRTIMGRIAKMKKEGKQ